MEASVRIDRFARRLLLGLIIAEVVLVLLDIAIQWAGWIDMRPLRTLFNVASEKTIPTWFASTQAFVVALAAVAVAYVARLRGESYVGWLLIAFFFTFVSADDAATIHERVGSAVQRWFAQDPQAQPFFIRWLLALDNFGWQAFVLPFFAAAGLAMFVFVLRRLRPHDLFGIFLAALVLWVVAVGIDFVEGIRDPRGESGGAYARMAEWLGVRRYTVSHFAKLIEEFLEMLGTSLFLYAFLRYLAVLADGLTLRFESADSESE